MDHGIGCDGIHFTVCPSVGSDITCEVRLFMEDIIPLEHDYQFLASQESMRQLCVPDKFIGIQRLVTIASFAEHVDVC